MSASAPDWEHVYTLHRYYMWSTNLQGHFERVLAGFAARGEAFSMRTDEGIQANGYMSYWYASLNVVVEGWQKLGLRDSKIDELLSSPNVEALLLYRHSVFPRGLLQPASDRPAHRPWRQPGRVGA